jgi:hypothetical protein
LPLDDSFFDVLLAGVAFEAEAGSRTRDDLILILL